MYFLIDDSHYESVPNAHHTCRTGPAFLFKIWIRGSIT